MRIRSKKNINEDILKILRSALEAVDPFEIIKDAIYMDGKELSICGNLFSLDNIGQLFLIGFGKAVLPMAKAAIEKLDKKISAGVLVAKHIDDKEIFNFPTDIKITTGSHPVPDEKSVQAAEMIIQSLKDVKENDLIITLISGGGSSLVTLPREPLTIKDLNELTQILLRSGATINEMNAIRKHLDQILGGGLLKFYHPARSINMILSDVIGNDLSVIASGPTSPDTTTFSDAVDILKKYGLWERQNHKIKKVLTQGMHCEIEETIKDNDQLLEKTNNRIVGSLAIAAQGAKHEAESLGYQSEIYVLDLSGEAEKVGKKLAQFIKKKKGDVGQIEKPLCIIAGGETTVTVNGNGKGGRNQEIALSAAIELEGSTKITFVTLATDGEDGPTDAAGAIVDGQTIFNAKEMGLNSNEYLENNDSYNFFSKTGELIQTGSTGTNVNDLVLIFAYP